MRTILLLLSICIFGSSFAQINTYPISSSGFNETELREKMTADGVPAAVIDKLVIQRKEMISRSGGHVETKSFKFPELQGTCADIGVENGWSSWMGAHGTNNGTNPPVWGTSTNPPPTPNGNNNISITSGPGVDPCTPGTAPGAPAIPVVAPGFGDHSIQLGVQQTTGCFAEQAIFTLNVTPLDTDFVYTFAAVMYDPVSGHAPDQKPFADFLMLDVNGDTIPCAYQHYVAGQNNPGWYVSNATCLGGQDAWYLPWISVGVDLSAYIGQAVTIIMTNADCVFCGHYAHSYWDFACGTQDIFFCTGQLNTLCAPTNAAFPYTYQWYHNGAIVPGGTNQCLSIAPNQIDTFSVQVNSPSGCNFNLQYVLQDTCTLYNVGATSTPDSCSKNIGTATATIQNGTPPYTYNWQPGGQTTQTATGLAAGTYTVTGIDSNSLTDAAIIGVGNSVMSGTVSTTSVTCFGGTTGSATANASGGTPSYTYLWNNGQTTQTATGLSSGSYSVVISDAAGCSISVSASVIGAPMINTGLGYTPSSCPTCPDGSAYTNAVGGTPPFTYAWSPGGQTTASIIGLLPGSYTVCVTDSKGCIKCDSVTLWVVGMNENVNESVSVFPNPTSANLFIDFGTKNFGSAEISFCDLVGRILYETTIPAIGKQMLDVLGFSKGVYFLKVKTGQGMATKKIVIAR